MFCRRDLFLLPLLLTSVADAAEKPNVTIGTYDLERMQAIKGLTFPRVMLYSRTGKLIDRRYWPTAIAAKAGALFAVSQSLSQHKNRATHPQTARSSTMVKTLTSTSKGCMISPIVPLLALLFPSTII
jgi:hypothetical protein